jgi:hypothetical protein
MPAVAASHERKHTGGLSLHILLAEDNPINQRVATRILEKEGHRVQIAESGFEAVAAEERAAAGPPAERFDLILMDVQMPGMDGLEATRAIRQREREHTSGFHIPIIAMTAHARPEDRIECLECGMDDYISKPIDARTLLLLIERRTSLATTLVGTLEK